MKKTKVKRLLAILLSLALFVGVFASTASAATTTVYMFDVPRGSDTLYKKNGWNNPDLTCRNGYKFHKEDCFHAKGVGSYYGKAAYCIETATPQRTGTSASQYNSSWLENQLKWNGALSPDQQTKILSYVLYNGYQGNINVDTWVSQNSSGANQLSYYFATQILVWETIVGERDINFNHISKSQTGAQNEVLEYMNSSNPEKDQIMWFYNKISSLIQEQLKLPSFMTKFESQASTYELTYDSKAKLYTVSLTDTNNVLDNYSFSGDGLNFRKDGNVLTVTSSQPFDVSTISATKTSNNQTSTLLVWGDGVYDYSGSKGKQDLMCSGDNRTDPLNGYVKLVAKQATGNLTITKTSEDGKTDFSFRVTGPDGYDQTVTTSAVDDGAKGAVSVKKGGKIGKICEK